MAEDISVLDEKSFDSFVKSGNVIVDFYADWCGPCKVMAPEFEKAAAELKDVKFGKLNIDGHQDIAGRFMVMSIPTVIFFKDGEQVDRHTGALSAEDIKKKAEKSF